MFKYVLNRLLHAPIVFLLLITLTFFMIRFAPGGPFSADRRLDPEIERALKAKYHLNKPLIDQYQMFLFDLVNGDLGPSFRHVNKSVNEIIAQTLPHSLYLGSVALLLALVSGISLGVISAIRHGSVIDHGLTASAVIGISLPAFVIGPLLQLVFAMRWKWLPVAGYEGLSSPSYLVLPAITLALPFAARIARLMRAGMLDALSQDYIRTARAKGLPESTVLFRHALPGGVFPVISFLGPACAHLATGSLVVEQIFQVPGLGREFIEAALNRDYTLVMGTVIVYGAMIILFNFLTDIIYAVIDPRLRYE